VTDHIETTPQLHENRNSRNGPQAISPAEILVIAYDCDGVLVDSRLANEAYYNYILGHFNLPRVHNDQRHMIQVLAASQVIDALFAGTGLTEKARLFEKSIVDHQFLELTRIEPHISDALKQIRKGRLTAVVSNRGKSLRPLLAHHGIGDLFDMVVGSDDVERKKPDPESLEKVMGHFSIRPDQVLYVGDSEIDQILCRLAGVPFVAYRNPELDALFNLNDHIDLLKILSSQKNSRFFMESIHG
jgi:phosphoglycolate phosphatase